MAQGGDLGNLIVRIDSDISQLQKGLKEASKSVEGFSASSSKFLNTATTAIATFGVAAAAAIAKATQEAVKFGNELDKLSKISGLAVHEVARLSYALQQEHGSAEQLNRTIPLLSKNIIEAANGNKETANAFRNLGVSIKDAHGNVRDVQDVLLQLSDGIKNSKNETEAMANAMKVLGRGAGELIPFLKLGSQEIRRLGDEFDNFGFSGDRLKKFSEDAKILDDEFQKLAMQLKVAGAAMAAELVPQVTQFVRMLNSFDWVSFATTIGNIAEFFLKIANALTTINTQFNQAGGMFGGFMGIGAKASGPAAQGFNASVFGAPIPAPAPVMPAGGGPAVPGQAGGGEGMTAGSLGTLTEMLQKFQEKVTETLTGTKDKLDTFKEGFMEFSSQLADVFGESIDGMFKTFGDSFAQMLVNGKDFAETMKAGFKDMAAQFISAVTSMIAKWLAFLALKLVLKFFGFKAGAMIGSLAMPFREGGGLFARAGAVMARNGVMSAAKGMQVTGALGEGGMPAIVHPNEIITPIDKFYDFMKQTQANAAPMTVNINGYNRDPRELAELVQIEADRKRRAP